MEDIFIKSIHINKVRHLENIDIPISETDRKHLILTGKNGSGKTSVLLEIKNWLEMIENDTYSDYIKSMNVVKARESAMRDSGENGSINLSPLATQVAWAGSVQYDRAKREIEKYSTNIELNFNATNVSDKFKHGDFVLTYFEAKRKLEINIPKGINKIERKSKYKVGENIGKDFLQYIVNLKADRSFARDENDEISVNQIDNWFDNFEKSLQLIFDDDNLKLEFDRKNYNFIIINDGNEVSDFTTLSDGYSAIFNIISELIMRMENKASKSYDIQGIVLIDEIETHLHIDLQKKILPFLTNFFPKIQFIVTTHSPFVLNSIKNAVIFDLEKKVLVEDMTGYSINSIVESYFDSDNYSTVVKEKMERYENLSVKEDLTEEEEEELFDLKEYFEDLPKMFSPELALKINQIQLANLSVK
jgi:predicted ATP-binding protein involved in virulence